MRRKMSDGSSPASPLGKPPLVALFFRADPLAVLFLRQLNAPHQKMHDGLRISFPGISEPR